ncbi:hypothetical protein COY93_02265 [Candidatus Uhrbacteria bacterium CG_4_10_14_0_8_um_filter_58_22]|uniref:Methyltransferase type 11 domain-containing protein n=1 Tax=Candidatus Uhrbacteria bacterium CG_4_10_14_0_8_um_filter_58_22 TaxID=1975029 RepID=A0A2M7QB59_9BACT|nr:MAG: hypothetical protein AUJ19_01160 [Parcubacteria group bacterium CG1_02_58_44]PIY62798.1 MAG: hypothetical protein COY93_02265 [Candidatus Uhrbacteria bacterium CG_4_10_14_0_8_um_filter_58_22]
MQNEELYRKYLSGRHWDSHFTAYAQGFADFLLSNGFAGRLVDLGCGSGRDVVVFRSRGIEVLGVDLSAEEIATARSGYPNCQFEVGDAEQLNFDDCSIGALFMINVVHYLDKHRALEEACRVLKPGGFFLIHFNTMIADQDGRVDYAQDESEILKLTRNFEVVRKNSLVRVDSRPIVHTHAILELILKRPLG